VRVQVFKAYTDHKKWDTLRTKQGVAPAFRNMVAQVAGSAFMDVYHPIILSYGTDRETISAKLRIGQTNLSEVLAASGLVGVFVKRLKFKPHGSIKWIRLDLLMNLAPNMQQEFVLVPSRLTFALVWPFLPMGLWAFV